MKNMLVHVLQKANVLGCELGYLLDTGLPVYTEGCGYCDEAQAYLFELLLD